MSDRDELAEEICGYNIDTGYYSTSIRMDDACAIADDILAAGYRKPRTITTVEESKALEVGVVLLDHTGDVLKLTHAGWMSTDDQGPSYVVVPATVLHEPTP